MAVLLILHICCYYFFKTEGGLDTGLISFTSSWQPFEDGLREAVRGCSQVSGLLSLMDTSAHCLHFATTFYLLVVDSSLMDESLQICKDRIKSNSKFYNYHHNKGLKSQKLSFSRKVKSIEYPLFDLIPVLVSHPYHKKLVRKRDPIKSCF